MCKYTTVKWPILYGIFMIKWHFKNVGDVVSVSHCGGLGSRPGPIQVIVFYVQAKILHFHSTSLCLGVWMGIGEFSGNPDEMLRGNLAIDWHPILRGVEGGGVVILLVVSCHRTWHKLLLDGSLDSSTDVTYLPTCGSETVWSVMVWINVWSIVEL